jgi:hypothetical protein
VVAGGRRPRIDAPRIDGALVWVIGSEIRPISATGIGSIVEAENLYVTRFRVVARRSGMLVVPAMQAQTRDLSGRSQPLHLTILPVPLLDRPAEFCGGVGWFQVEAEATPKVIRAGQQLAFRIKIGGPAAWGMTARPELPRLKRLRPGMRIEPEPDVVTDEPPERTFVYRLRPTQAGDQVLPPVAIAAFDPVIKRFVTHVTASVPIRVVAVPRFDPATIEGGHATSVSIRLREMPWIAAGISAILLLGSYGLLARVRRRSRHGPATGPAAARRYAARLGRGQGFMTAPPGLNADVAAADRAAQGLGQTAVGAARGVNDAMVRYLELGIGRPAGALTPDEAQQGVATITDSAELGRQAAGLTARCDLALYRGKDGEPRARELLVSARALFHELGRAKGGRRRSR